MSLGDKQSDWQVCGAIAVAAADVAGAGLFVFDFYSKNAGGTGRFVFKGAGIGLGGNASGTMVPDEIGPFGPWSSITVDEPFSIWDLNGAWGRLSSASMGAGLLFGVTYITAAPPWSLLKSYFHSQNVGGFSKGAGAGALVFVGNWRFKKVTSHKPSESVALTA